MEISKYLSGDKFDDDYCYRPAVTFDKQSRGDILERWCAGRSVLHVGFADHEPLIAARLAAGEWLHSRLSRSARECYGIDINVSAVQAAQQLGFDKLYALDIHTPEAADILQSLSIDLVMVPDVVEHLSNPSAFLGRLATLFPAADFVISAPNGLSLRNTFHTARGVERINTDHRAWLSPYTLQKVLADAGLQAIELWGCSVSTPCSIKGRILHHLMQWRPLGADVIIARARRFSR
ncbi:MAG: methyltransferase domain-containing protein [Comamonadaceae bacterium]|nr:MAG: methyltransferase domain-containing protein [Comamonadaceae bacterium]